MNKRRQSATARAANKRASADPLAVACPVSRRELAGVLAIVTAAIAVRWLFLERAAVEHFDEGVYASKFFFGPNGSWPSQHLYAPPLLPAVIEILMMFLGVSDLTAISPALICGTATVLLIWWMGRTWFRPAAGLAAAILAATSDMHAAFSRMALTDVPLTLFLLAGVFAWERSIARASLWWSIAAGLLTGIAGLTKYNGWLAIAIATGGAAAWLVTSRLPTTIAEASAERPGFRRLLVNIVTMTAVAFACWAPYLWSLQSQGGYAAVAQNHAKYVVGLLGWTGSACRQFANHLFLETALSCLGIAAAWIMLRSFDGDRADAESPSRQREPLIRFLGEGLLFAALTAWVGTLPLLTLGGIACSFRALSRPAALGEILVVAGWWLLLAMTPLYYPYARLTLPWLAFSWLAAAGGSSWLLANNSRALSTSHSWQWLLGGVITIGLTGYFSPRFLRQPTAWQPRTGARQAASQFAQAIRQQQRLDDETREREPTVFVLGEPALVFHLRALGVDVVAPVQQPLPNMKDPDLPTARVWLVIGPQGKRDPAYTGHWPEYSKFWRPQTETDIELSDIMLLDLFDPLHFSWQEPPRKATMRLYVWRPEH